MVDKQWHPPVDTPGPPGITSNVRVRTGNGSARVTWQTPITQKAPVSGYDVEYRPASSRGRWAAQQVAAGTIATITGLTNDSQYVYRVRARSSAGNGKWSIPVSATPNINAVVGPSLTIPAIGETSGSGTKILWTAPFDNGGDDLASYEIEYRKRGKGQWKQVTPSPAAGATETDIAAIGTGEDSGSEYMFRIRALNSRRHGQWASSGWVVLEPASAPAASRPDRVARPLLTARDTRIEIAWTAPADNGAAITGYDIQKATNNRMSRPAAVSNTGVGTTTVAAGLVNGTTYYFRIRAKNFEGTGRWSVIVSAAPTAVATVPGRVTGLTITASDEQVACSWDVPDDGDSPITGYIVHRSFAADMSDHSEGRYTDPSFTDTGLINGRTYYYRVKAENGLGTGEWSSVASATPAPPAVQSAPENLRMRNNHSTWIRIEWDPPSGGDEPGLQYEPRYRLATTTEWTTLPEITARQVKVDDLSTGTSYDFQVRAKSRSGVASSWTGTITESTR